MLVLLGRISTRLLFESRMWYYLTGFFVFDTSP